MAVAASATSPSFKPIQASSSAGVFAESDVDLSQLLVPGESVGGHAMPSLKDDAV